MEKNEQEIIDSTIDTDKTENEVLEQEIVLEEDVEDVELLKKQIQTLSAQKDHWKKKATEPKVEVKKEVKVEQPKVEVSDDIVLARLEARGYIDQDEQDEIIRASKALGISPVAALKDSLVLERIERIRNKKKTQEATPEPKGRANGSRKDVNYFIEKGEVPEDGEMADKVIEILRAKERAKRI